LNQNQNQNQKKIKNYNHRGRRGHGGKITWGTLWQKNYTLYTIIIKSALKTMKKGEATE
jgi:hypothetical protein